MIDCKKRMLPISGSLEIIYKRKPRIRSITNSKKLILINNTVIFLMKIRKLQCMIKIVVKNLELTESQLKNTDLLPE